MATTILTLTHNESAADMTARLQDEDKRDTANKIRNYMAALASGSKSAKFDLQISEGNAAAATGTVVFSGVGAAADTILVNGVTFTAVASGATGNQWNVGATATLSAAALAAAITASATALVSGYVTASAATGTRAARP